MSSKKCKIDDENRLYLINDCDEERLEN